MTSLTRRQTITTAASAALLGTAHLAGESAAVSASPATADDLVRALERDAHPLGRTGPGGSDRDLHPFGRMVGGAAILTVGEASHGTRELTTMHQRLFHFLTRHHGFTTFAREIGWGAGVQLDDYVQHGTGNPRDIMDRELETFYQVFDTAEFLELVESLRRHNQTHRDRVHIMGMDVAFPSPALFEKVDAYLAEHHPDQRAAFDALYTGLRPEPGTHLGEFQETYLTRPIAEREQQAARARTAVRLMRGLAPARTSRRRSSHAWVLQHTRAIAQAARGSAFDTDSGEGVAEFGRYREEAMADNLLWWREHTGDRIMVSTMNTHASYEVIEPEVVPRPLGSHLRERLGRRHVNAGFSFARGCVNSLTPPEEGKGDDLRRRLDAKPGSNEHVLDRVRHDHYVLDMRSAPRLAQRWLTRSRRTFNVGGYFDGGVKTVALLPSYDVLFHLDEVTPGTPLWE